MRPFTKCAVAVFVAAIGLRAETKAIPPAAPDSFGGLPIVEVPARAAEGDFFALMISGDGGWATLDKGLSAELSARGVPVVGLDSLKYFWHARGVEQTTADVDRLVGHYASLWNKKRVLLIGYSFGADVMPAVFNRLPPESSARVASINLLGLGAGATYHISAANWLPFARPNASAVLPEVERLGSTRTLCIEGAGEKKTICPELARLGVEVRQIGAGHHFSYLHKSIADAILGSPADEDRIAR